MHLRGLLQSSHGTHLALHAQRCTTRCKFLQKHDTTESLNSYAH